MRDAQFLPRDVEPTRAMAAFALATFNVVLVVIVVLTLAYRGGGLGDALSSLNTVLGLGLFAAFWLLTWSAVAHALAPLPLEPRPGWMDVWGRGARWGGIAGAVVLEAAVVVFALRALLSAPSANPLDLAVALVTLAGFAGVGGVVAFAIGAIVGFVFATIDALLLWLAQSGSSGGAPTSPPFDATSETGEARSSPGITPDPPSATRP